MVTCVYEQHLKVYHEEGTTHLNGLESKSYSFGYAVDGSAVFQRLQETKKVMEYCVNHYMEKKCPLFKAGLIEL